MQHTGRGTGERGRRSRTEGREGGGRSRVGGRGRRGGCGGAGSEGGGGALAWRGCRRRTWRRRGGRRPSPPGDWAGPPSFPPSPGRETLAGGAEGELGRGSLQVLFPEVGPAAVGVYGSNRPMGKKKQLITFYFILLLYVGQY